ncbi:hypothetical protein CDD83_5323 [Cordyceps sp. RAO-2017]|nr:hypothetical protein CDD83_5323 [Cordyceps sp. RAO-2017]
MYMSLPRVRASIYSSQVQREVAQGAHGDSPGSTNMWKTDKTYEDGAVCEPTSIAQLRHVPRLEPWNQWATSPWYRAKDCCNLSTGTASPFVHPRAADG